MRVVAVHDRSHLRARFGMRWRPAMAPYGGRTAAVSDCEMLRFRAATMSRFRAATVREPVPEIPASKQLPAVYRSRSTADEYIADPGGGSPQSFEAEARPTSQRVRCLAPYFLTDVAGAFAAGSPAMPARGRSPQHCGGWKPVTRNRLPHGRGSETERVLSRFNLRARFGMRWRPAIAQYGGRATTVSRVRAATVREPVPEIPTSKQLPAAYRSLRTSDEYVSDPGGGSPQPVEAKARPTSQRVRCLAPYFLTDVAGAFAAGPPARRRSIL
jgi:hypothetical protein